MPSLTHGDTSNLADGTAVTAAEMLGTVAAASLALADDNAVKRLGYKGHKRYVRLTVTASAVTTGGTVSAIALLGAPALAPTS